MTINEFRPQTIGALAPAALEAIYAQRTDGGILGLSTGFGDLDRALDGLHRGDVVAIAGRPSMGCSTLALNIGLNAATKAHRSVLVAGIPGIAEVIVARHPSGRRGVVKLAVSKPFGWFEDAVDDEGIDI